MGINSATGAFQMGVSSATDGFQTGVNNASSLRFVLVKNVIFNEQ